MTKKRIAVFTTIRSEYGLLSPLLEALAAHPGYELRLLAGGAHLLEAYGHTIDQIRQDGFAIAQTFPFLYADALPDSNVRSVATLQHQIGSYLAANPPDMLLMLGDRFELMPAALAALMANVPIAHLSGGEVTEGAVDNQIRHSLTKMAHLHFPATAQYGANIRQMGEEAWRICVCGEPGIDLMMRIRATPRAELYEELGLDAQKQTFLATFHPETLSGAINPALVTEVFQALMEHYADAQILVTAANFDEGGPALNAAYERLAAENPGRLIYVKSLGQRRYYSMLRHAALMIGNSSSGLIEAQTYHLPVLNVGNRQLGRLANTNVLHVPAHAAAIVEEIHVALSASFREGYAGLPNIYGDGEACSRIMHFLDAVPWERLLIKRDAF